MPFKKTALRGWRKFIEFLTGQEFDKEYQFYNYGARLYDPVMGRFITPDSELPDWYNPQSLNRYVYTKNNPLKYIDPSGNIALNTDGTVTSFTSDALRVNETLVGGIKDDFVSGNYGAAAIGALLWTANSISTLPFSMAADAILTGPYNSGASGMAGILEGDTVKGVTGFTGCFALGLGGKLSAPVQFESKAAESAAPKVGDKLTRYWGGDSGPFGESWTRDPISTTTRDSLGLGRSNTAEYITQGILKDTTGVTTRRALSWDGFIGGGDEVLIPDALNQIEIESVTMPDFQLPYFWPEW